MTGARIYRTSLAALAAFTPHGCSFFCVAYLVKFCRPRLSDSELDSIGQVRLHFYILPSVDARLLTAQWGALADIQDIHGEKG